MPSEDDTLSAPDRGTRSPVELPAGRMFAQRYMVEERIGQGGMGIVYRARDQRLDDVVALKLLTLSTELAIERFLAEVRLARRITHPNVARTHDMGEFDGVHFLTMEYVAGGSLEEQLDKRGALPLHDAVAIGRAIGNGLEAAHRVALPRARPASAQAVCDALDRARAKRATTTPTSGAYYAPLSPGGPTIAVLPWAYRGPSEHDYLGEALAEELIDVLARTKGLRVLALGATRRFAEERDPARVARELGAECMVDGTVYANGERVRSIVRLIDAATGEQRWSERYDGSFGDVFALQETTGRRVAEALRLELAAAAHRDTASPARSSSICGLVVHCATIR